MLSIKNWDIKCIFFLIRNTPPVNLWFSDYAHNAHKKQMILINQLIINVRGIYLVAFSIVWMRCNSYEFFMLFLGNFIKFIKMSTTSRNQCYVTPKIIHNNKRQNAVPSNRHHNFGKCFVSPWGQLDDMRCGYLLLQFNLCYMHHVLL